MNLVAWRSVIAECLAFDSLLCFSVASTTVV